MTSKHRCRSKAEKKKKETQDISYILASAAHKGEAENRKSGGEGDAM